MLTNEIDREFPLDWSEMTPAEKLLAFPPSAELVRRLDEMDRLPWEQASAA